MSNKIAKRPPNPTAKNAWARSTKIPVGWIQTLNPSLRASGTLVLAAAERTVSRLAAISASMSADVGDTSARLAPEDARRTAKALPVR